MRLYYLSKLSDLSEMVHYRDLYTQRRILKALVKLGELLEDKPLLK